VSCNSFISLYFVYLLSAFDYFHCLVYYDMLLCCTDLVRAFDRLIKILSDSIVCISWLLCVVLTVLIVYVFRVSSKRKLIPVKAFSLN